VTEWRDRRSNVLRKIGQ